MLRYLVVFMLFLAVVSPATGTTNATGAADTTGTTTTAGTMMTTAGSNANTTAGNAAGTVMMSLPLYLAAFFVMLFQLTA